MNSELINIEMKKYKFVHILYNDKFCVPFVDFMNRNYAIEDHLFLIMKTLTMFPVPVAKNVIIFNSFDGLDFEYHGIKKVIMHSLFLPGCFRYWFSHQSVQIEKAYWMIYGGDLYEAPRDEVADTVRRGFKGYISDTDGDCRVVKEKYELSHKEYYDAGYAFPITEEMVKEALSFKPVKNYIQIQINNSSDESTIEMLEKLSRFNNRNIRIGTILSYGQTNFNEEIIRVGQKIYGDKFWSINQLMTPWEYTKWLSGNDILILNQNRQQGLGNSFASLALGTKLYIKSSVTTFSHFNEKGIVVFDTKKIDSENYEELIEYKPDISKRNMEMSCVFFKDEYLKKCWDPIFR